MTNEENIKEPEFLFYKSWYETIKAFLKTDSEVGKNIALGIIEYGCTGEVISCKSPYKEMILGMVAPNVDSAKNRYKKAVEAGKRGGRPSQIDKNEVFRLKEEGLSNKEIAEKLNSNTNTVKQILHRNKDTKGTKQDNDLDSNFTLEQENRLEFDLDTILQIFSDWYREFDRDKRIMSEETDYSKEDIQFALDIYNILKKSEKDNVDPKTAIDALIDKGTFKGSKRLCLKWFEIYNNPKNDTNEQWGEEDNIISNLNNLDFDPQDPDFEDLY